MDRNLRKPNVLILFSDQQRWDTLGCYGSPMNLTPNLDAMAQRGTRFETAITNQPVCGPARACILSGQYGTSHGVWKNGRGLSPNIRTMAHCFSDAGYRVGYIGKWHLSPRENGCGQVEMKYRGGFREHWEAANVLEHTSHPYEGSIFDADGNEMKFADEYRVDFLAGRVDKYIRDHEDEPFFLMASWLEPHHQNDLNRFVAPEVYADKLKNPFVPQDLRPYSGDWFSELPDYYGMVARLDESVGNIMSTLSELGLEQDTIVLFVSDHGCHFRTRNSEYKRSAHDSCLRIPMIYQGPGFDRSSVVPELVSLVDIAPTLLSAAGIDVPEGMQGGSAMPLIDRDLAAHSNEVLIQISESMVGRAIRTERWKYCVVAPDIGGGEISSADEYLEYQMYDLYADPFEHINLAGRKDYRDVADHLKQRLSALMVDAGELEPTIHPAKLYP